VLSVFWDVVASEHLASPLLGRFFGLGVLEYLMQFVVDWDSGLAFDDRWG
jgi:hypothetical protein